MPKYELMYIIGGDTSDDEIPKIIEGVSAVIQKNGGEVEKAEDLGKKKFAYPINKARNGNYVLVNFAVPAKKIEEIEHQIKTNQTIARHLLINMDNAIIRMEKDRIAQATLKQSQPKEDVKEKVEEKPATDKKKIDIDLDAEIEKAIEPKELK